MAGRWLRRAGWVALMAALPTIAAGQVADTVTAFDRPAPWADSHVLADRMLSPVTADRLRGMERISAVRLVGQTSDPARERFDLYVPERPRDAGGYGLLVWIAPSGQAPVPRDWRGTLEREGIIYVAAQDSGNDQDVLERRVPLALHAAYNVMQRYPVDPSRVFVGGFSGGSRVALKLAVGYPDVFRGVLLNAGSDMLGDRLVLPARELVELLRQRSRFVYVTGVLDLRNKVRDEHSRRSLHEACIDGVETIYMAATEHAPPGRRHLEQALHALQQRGDRDVPARERCRSDLRERIDRGLMEVERLLAAGEHEAAAERLETLDRRWGGLAAPRSVALARAWPAQQED